VKIFDYVIIDGAFKGTGVLYFFVPLELGFGSTEAEVEEGAVHGGQLISLYCIPVVVSTFVLKDFFRQKIRLRLREDAFSKLTATNNQHRLFARFSFLLRYRYSCSLAPRVRLYRSM